MSPKPCLHTLKAAEDLTSLYVQHRLRSSSSFGRTKHTSTDYPLAVGVQGLAVCNGTDQIDTEFLVSLPGSIIGCCHHGAIVVFEIQAAEKVRHENEEFNMCAVLTWRVRGT